MAKLTKEEAVKAIQNIEGEEVLVFTPGEHADVLRNFSLTTVDKELKGRIGRLYAEIDADFESATGIKRPDDNETLENKSYKFWPETLKKIKAKAEQAEAEVVKLKTNNGSPDLVKEIEALRKASIEKDNEWKVKMAQVQTELSVKDIKNTLDLSTRDLKLSNLPKPVVDTFIEAAKNKLAAIAKIVNGEVIFMDSDGEPLMNKETYKPYSSAELMAKELEPIIEKGKESKGGGSVKPTIQKDKDGKIDISVIIPTTVRTKSELTNHLISSGLAFNTPDYYAAYDKYSVNLPIA
jgi:hypothetical protein